MGKTLRVLIVEDSENDALLTVQELRRGGYEPAFERVETADAMGAALKARGWDVIVADYSLPRFNGLAAIELVRDRGLDIPVIVVSGAIGEETAVAAMKAGASDYVMKGNLARLGPAVERELRQAEVRREHRQMEERLRATERLQLIGQLVLGVAHEIRNPLHGITSVVEALGEEIGKDPVYQEYVHHIRAQVDRMARLVTDLLDMGRPLDPGRMHPESLLNICSAALALWKESKSDLTHAITLTSPPSAEGLDITADGARLQQAIINLVDNAAQNSPDGSEVRVEILEPDEKTVRVRVVDGGTGIAAENTKKVFEPFFTTRRGGTGLGLCIVQRVVKDHGGDITLQNNDPPPGVTVEVRLPRPA
ncbi:MAG: ATP-binding protein [Verrucomicrobiota bacterium]